MITLEKNGIPKKVATGYSFKSLFFGALYPMARGDFKGVIIQVLLAVITFGLCWLIVPFVYNDTYIKRLVRDGYKPMDEKANQYLRKHYKYSA